MHDLDLELSKNIRHIESGFPLVRGVAKEISSESLKERLTKQCLARSAVNLGSDSTAKQE